MMGRRTVDVPDPPRRTPRAAVVVSLSIGSSFYRAPRAPSETVISTAFARGLTRLPRATGCSLA